MTLLAGNLPTASDLARSAGGYAPGTGVLPMQLGTPTTDSNANANNQQSAPLMVQNAAGTATIGAHAQVDGFKASYAASVTALVLAANPTDVFTIAGSSTKTIRITRLRVSGFRTTGAATDVQLIVRSTVDTAGTKTNPTTVPYDSANAAATAIVAAYTANPTLGTAVGTLAADNFFLAANTAASGTIDLTFGNRPAQAIVLRGATQQLCVNFNAAAVAGGTLDIWVEFTEE